MGERIKTTSSSKGPWTLVLLGRTGNGKSSTGNSILGKKVFKQRTRSSGGISTCELQQTVTKDGKIVNVIDTPGLFSSDNSESIGKEIVKCISMAKDGIHAILLVLSVRTRFSEEEEAAIQSLQNLFGSKMFDYMIVVFTGGDEFEDNEDTLDDYLGRQCPHPLKEILRLCDNRKVLFDNKTQEERKKNKQVQELLSLVNMVVTKNGGRPYTDELFSEVKKGDVKVDQQEKTVSFKAHPKQQMVEEMQRAREEELNQIVEMVESKVRGKTIELEQRLKEEQIARLEEQEKYTKEISKLQMDLKEAKNNGQEKQFDERDLNRLADMVESRLREIIDRLGQQLAEEVAARQKEGLVSLQKLMELYNKIYRLVTDLERAQRENKQFQNNTSQPTTISLTLPPLSLSVIHN